jgi:predicted NAD-dependent protein-ADP-ribosyltransferase YbiA (DUF1768 family)
MSVTFMKKKGEPPPKKEMGDAFERWYQRHGSEFNQSRRTRYANDPLYRERVLATSARARANRRKNRVVQKPAAYSINLAEAASQLGVTVWSLRSWRNNQYFPDPLRCSGEVWFTAHQIVLIGRIRDFLDARHIRKISASDRKDMQPLIDEVLAQWGG